jgi:DNA-binding response OmpR family regulator
LGLEPVPAEGASTVDDPRPTLILVVDDDEALQQIYQELLEDEGYAVTVWPYPAASTADVATLAPGLVLLDFVIDGAETGWHFLQALKADPATVDTPILVVSAADALLKRVAEQLSAWDCAVLRKPFDLDELLAAVRTCLGKADVEQVAD